MNDAKTKLGQMKAYEYDASKFKLELKRKLMQEYHAQYGIEEDFRAQAPEKKSFFNFNKLVFTPIMAILVLAVFISYEYVNKPMTAYAYLKQVEKHNSDLKDGVKVHTIHTVNGYTLDVEVLRDKDGNLQVNVSQEGNTVENFVMHDGVLYVKEDVKPVVEMMAEAAFVDNVATDRADELTSILNSLVLADLADPQDEWKDIMTKDDVTFTEEENGLVRIAYEENFDGKVFINELSFRDFAPVSKIRKQKFADDVNRSMIARNDVETIEYRELQAIEHKVKKPSEYVVFVQNKEFNKKMSEFVDTDIDDLVREYNDLSDKESYFAWDRKELALPVVEPEVAAIMSDIAQPTIEHELPTIVAPTLVGMPGTIETMELPKVAPGHKTLVRDAYLENVFYDLLKDDEQPKTAPPTEGRFDGDEALKIIEAPYVDVITPLEKVIPVSDPHVIDLPKDDLIDKHLDVPISDVPVPVDGVVDLIDHSIPEPYMAEPMDKPLDGVEINATKTPSYMELLENRETMQDDLANRRFQLRMQQQTEELNPTDRVFVPTPPKSEFKKVE
ncbi:MAG: hypothetical protein Q8P68_05375 [Candidatus Peregrinibacteria bacterium]|nr:hypothetical protein [Candidatus Peregrinibacteria bacterium]MDZ4244377.1 hypothetical protein [Candidatus Gracilibacteria bacterium]